jgi:hypothetical protein
MSVWEEQFPEPTQPTTRVIREGEQPSAGARLTDYDPFRVDTFSPRTDGASLGASAARLTPPLSPTAAPTGGAGSSRPSVGFSLNPLAGRQPSEDPSQSVMSQSFANPGGGRSRGSSVAKRQARLADSMASPSAAAAPPAQRARHASMVQNGGRSAVTSPQAGSGPFVGGGLSFASMMLGGGAAPTDLAASVMVPVAAPPAAARRPSGHSNSNGGSSAALNPLAGRSHHSGSSGAVNNNQFGALTTTTPRHNHQPSFGASQALNASQQFGPVAAGSGFDLASPASIHRDVVGRVLQDEAGDDDEEVDDEDARAIAGADQLQAEQIFMPSLKREQYVPMRVARDKVKQALAEMASMKAQHYAAIDTMERQYKRLKAQLEAAVVAYTKKLTKDYNERVANLEAEFHRRVANGTLTAAAFHGEQNDAERAAQRLSAVEEALRRSQEEVARLTRELHAARNGAAGGAFPHRGSGNPLEADAFMAGAAGARPAAHHNFHRGDGSDPNAATVGEMALMMGAAQQEETALPRGVSLMSGAPPSNAGYSPPAGDPYGAVAAAAASLLQPVAAAATAPGDDIYNFGGGDTSAVLMPPIGLLQTGGPPAAIVSTARGAPTGFDGGPAFGMPAAADEAEPPLERRPSVAPASRPSSRPASGTVSRALAMSDAAPAHQGDAAPASRPASAHPVQAGSSAAAAVASARASAAQAGVVEGSGAAAAAIERAPSNVSTSHRGAGDSNVRVPSRTGSAAAAAELARVPSHAGSTADRPELVRVPSTVVSQPGPRRGSERNVMVASDHSAAAPAGAAVSSEAAEPVVPADVVAASSGHLVEAPGADADENIAAAMSHSRRASHDAEAAHSSGGGAGVAASEVASPAHGEAVEPVKSSLDAGVTQSRPSSARAAAPPPYGNDAAEL